MQILPEVLVLLLSIISLFIGPLLYLWLREGGIVAKTFDSVIVATLIVLMCFSLIPESWRDLGYWSLALIFTGYLLPGLLEGLIRKAAHTLHLISLVLALAGLALHAMLDGAALAVDGADASNSLSMVITLHRIGVGLMLWMMVQPVFGKRSAYGVLGFVALATVGGHQLSEAILSLESGRAIATIQALIIGMIGHSLVHRSHGEGRI